MASHTRAPATPAYELETESVAVRIERLTTAVLTNTPFLEPPVTDAAPEMLPQWRAAAGWPTR